MLHTLNVLAKVIALVAIFLINPFIIGTVYAGFIVLHYASKSVRNNIDRFVAFFIASITVGYIVPLFFEQYPRQVFCWVFAAVLTWVFLPIDKEADEIEEDYIPTNFDDLIEAEVVSVETVNDTHGSDRKQIQTTMRQLPK
jgi:uncharacterized membrane protein YraQ (UPF0718 family)